MFMMLPWEMKKRRNHRKIPKGGKHVQREKLCSTAEIKYHQVESKNLRPL